MYVVLLVLFGKAGGGGLCEVFDCCWLFLLQKHKTIENEV